MSQKGNVSEFVKDIPKELVLMNEKKHIGIEFEIVVCHQCESKIEEHYKFCPECGNAIIKNTNPTVLETDLFNNIKEKVNDLPR
ncbi:hypothetical protein SAMN04487911_1541 [Arenibacter nanhaiticus]|uniref:Zinc-ribbon domain-containing protein n=1 Tax=Arenibacter nanhaiticus TaxID=558155 RepID=A0A1M6N340_9FLAO|nr:zinc-ribbon domain-containing protein [Arenibacter nanhaiticus]SHJ90076.1 hypothetical protein SAMN04487911_1541 [Arenibacter nanhaiticus]